MVEAGPEVSSVRAVTFGESTGTDGETTRRRRAAREGRITDEWLVCNAALQTSPDSATAEGWRVGCGMAAGASRAERDKLPQAAGEAEFTFPPRKGDGRRTVTGSWEGRCWHSYERSSWDRTGP